MQSNPKARGCWLTVVLLLALAPSAAANDVLRVATTSSIEQSGLLRYLQAAFEEKHKVSLKLWPVGTEQGLGLAERGEVDVVIANYRPAESTFLASGWSNLRRDLLYTDYFIAGPASDPAGIRGSKDVLVALGRIAASASPFVSRADGSGTDQVEKGYWRQLNIQPDKRWYTSANLGMGETLRLAAALKGYVLTDRASYFALKAENGLDLLVAGDNRMLNPYGVLVVNPDRHPRVNHVAATRFVQWLTSGEGQRRISDFKVSGQQVFFPAAMIAPLTDQVR